MESTEFNMKTEKPSLSACMIVKNEEKLLPQCLESIKDAVDELIIVDTGSTDRTVAIAESYGARVFQHPWSGNFSEARNYSLQQATSDWILVIDADEKLEADDIPALTAALDQNGYNCIFVQVISETPSGLSKNNSQRVFRRGEGHYEGIVHNQLVCEGDNLATKIRIYHYGYNLSPEQMKEKSRRTTELLKKQIAEKPDFLFARANLVRAYRCQELWDDAIRTAEEALKLKTKHGDPLAYQMLLCDMTYSLFVKKDYHEAEKRCLELLEVNPDNIDGHFYMAGIYVCTGRHQEAVEHYKKYISLLDGKDQPDTKFVNVIVDSYGAPAQAWNNMGNSYVQLGQFDKAVAALRRAISHDERNPLYYENLGRAFLEQNRPDQAAEVFEDAVKMGIATSQIHRQLNGIYSSRKKTDQKDANLRKAEAIHGNAGDSSPDTRPTLSACMIVKNEEKFLPQCLESIKDVVDEIIIVDTGSTDRTVEIAESCGAKVFHHPWNGNFSEARNYSLQYATCDWILVIDADEKMEKDDIPFLLAALKLEQYDSMWLAVLNKVRDGISMSYSQRVFRRGMGHYKGIVHNQLMCQGKSLITEIRLHHYGYDLSPEQMKKKQKRTESLLKKQIAENPNYMTARMNLARVYRSQELWDDVIKTAEEALSLNSKQQSPIDPQVMLCDLTYALFMKGKYEEAEKRCQELLDINPDNLDGRFYMGNILVSMGKHQEAIEHYKEYTELLEHKGGPRRKFVNLMVDSYGAQAQAWSNMGKCYVELGQPEKATELLEKALKMDLANSQMHRQLSDIYDSQGKKEQAEEHLKKAQKIDNSSIIPTLSACMIVKNEEELLPQCLESIKDVVDEIIIVDTGSTDKTVEIAESYGARVFHHPWRGDFSEARNHSLKYATCDWILIIDADEKLEKHDVPILRSVLKLKEYNCICFAVLSEVSTATNKGTSVNYSQRVFRRGKGHYEGIVHNQLIVEGQNLVTQIRLYHYGYNLSPEQMSEKYKRTEDLLKKQIARRPDFLFAQANLTRIYRCQEMWDEVIKTAEEALKLNPEQENPVDRQMILGDMTYALLMKENYDEAERRGRELLAANPDNMDGHFYMGGVYTCKSKYDKAIRQYMKYIKLSEKKKPPPTKFIALISDTHNSQAQAWNNIGNCYVNLKRFDKAAQAFQKAISYDDRGILYYENFARSLIDLKRPDRAAGVLEGALELGLDSTWIRRQLSSIYRSQGKIDLSIEHTRRALEMDGAHVGFYIHLSELLILQGQEETDDQAANVLEEAEALLREALEMEPEHPIILHNLARTSVLISNISSKDHEKSQMEKQASGYIDRIMESDNLDANQYMRMGGDWISMERYDTAITLYERCLKSEPNNCDALINLASCYAKLGMYESAIIGYRAALVMRPNDPTIMSNLLALRKDIQASLIEA